MTQHKLRNAERKPALPGGTLPDFLVWPVLLVIPLICLVGSWTTPYVATPDELKAAASQVLLTTFLLVYFWTLRRHKQSELRISAPTWSFVALFLLGTASLLWAANPEFWFYKWSRWYAGFVIFLFALQLRQNTKNLDRVFLACLSAGVITAVVGSAQQLFYFSLIPQTAFPASTFGNGNVAGEIMIFSAPLGLYFLCKPDISRRGVWLCVLAMCLIGMYTFYTRTRAVWLAVFLEICLLGAFIVFDPRRATWLHWHRGKSVAAVTGLLVFLVMINFSYRGFEPFWRIAAFEMSSIVPEIENKTGETASARYLIWNSTMEMIKDSPWIGTGVGSFFEVNNNGGYNNMSVLGVQRVHNDVLELAVDLGVLGLLCLTAIIVTFCLQLYLIFLHTSGKHRLVYALLVIAVTGSMLEAQLAFPYELPVPLIMMPLYMALVIRGAEHVVPAQCRQFHPGLWFNRSALSATALMLVLVSVINVQWLLDFRQLNRYLGDPVAQPAWKPDSIIYSQAHITAARGVAEALKAVNMDLIAMSVMKPAVDYWPDTVGHTLAMAMYNTSLGRLSEAEVWARKTITVQPDKSYVGEMILLDIYNATGDGEKLLALYNDLKSLPLENSAASANLLRTLHYQSIMLGDEGSTPRFYALYVEKYREMNMVEANQAVFLINTGNITEALPHIQKALALDENLPQGSEFRRLLAENQQVPETRN